jgi:hypothetical protein
MSPDTKEKLLLLIAGSLFTLAVTVIGAFLGQYFSQRNAERMFRLQRQHELRERSYSRLVGLKIPWSQAVQTHLEAKMLSEYYYVRFQKLSHNPDDLAEAKRQNDRALGLIPTISSLQREAFEALADARISYMPTVELDRALDALYDFRTIEVHPLDRNTITSEADLDQWKEKLGKELVALSRAAFQDKVETVLPHLLEQLREGRLQRKEKKK